MTVTIELSTEEEARLCAAARSAGTGPEECAKRLLTAQLFSLRGEDSTLAPFSEWDAEDATEDPDELAARNREWENLKHDLNKNRRAVGAEPLFDD